MLSVAMKVLRHLNDVHAVLFGDFLGCGGRQALFMPHVVNNAAADILSMIDAEVQVAPGDADNFGRQFLLTDFSQVTIDRWNPAAVL